MLVLNYISIFFFSSYEFDVYFFANVFHRFAKYTVLQFEKSLFQMYFWQQFFPVC